MVDHSWPAGAIAPVSVAGSAVSVPAYGSTLSPGRAGSSGRYDVRRMPSGSRIRSRTASHQVAPCRRATTSPSRAKPRLE